MDEKVWDEIARAYEQVVVQTSFYKEMIDDILGQVRGCQNVLDMGCGVGYLVERLLENPNRKVIGVDNNQNMLDITKNRIINSSSLERVTLAHGNVVTFDYPQKFDAVVSSNVLFNLDKPYDFLDNCYRSLRDGGKLVLASLKPGHNLDATIDATLQEFRDKGTLTKEMVNHIRIIKDINRRMMKKGEQGFVTFDNREIEKVLIDFIGFENILHSGSTYLDQDFLVTTEKPKKEPGIIYKKSSEHQKSDIGRFLYHCFHERYNLIPANDIHRFNFDDSEDVISFVAMRKSTNNIVGHLSFLGDIKNQKCKLKDKILNTYPNVWRTLEKKFKTIGGPNRWIVLPRYQNQGIGNSLFKELFDYSVELKIDCWVIEANPQLVPYLHHTLKAQHIGFVESSVSAPSFAMYIDLSKLSREIFERD